MQERHKVWYNTS